MNEWKLKIKWMKKYLHALCSFLVTDFIRTNTKCHFTRFLLAKCLSGGFLLAVRYCLWKIRFPKVIVPPKSNVIITLLLLIFSFYSIDFKSSFWVVVVFERFRVTKGTCVVRPACVVAIKSKLFTNTNFYYQLLSRLLFTGRMKLQQNFIMLNSVVYYSLIFNFYFSLRFSSGKRSVSLHLNNEERHFDEWKVNITKNVFIKKTIRNGKQSRKITPHIDDNSVYVDGIIHSEIKNQSKDWPKIKLIEKRFKNMLAMKGVKLIYKRDMFWRTWRVVSFSDNSKRALYYKCTHIINSNCSDCFGGGFWVSWFDILN